MRFIFLDIAYPEEMIYIEYDGSGHDLNVKLGKTSIEKFKFNEFKRFNYLKKEKWKMIKIISKKDLLPNDELIIKLIKYCKNMLINNSWIIIDIDKSIIKGKDFVNNIELKELRKIKDEI